MSEALDQGMVGSKDRQINTLEIINSGGQSIDVRDIFGELQIYQDLFSSVMHGSILINDGKDLFNNFYFHGNEYLRLSIDKPSLGEPLEKVFRIYKAENRKPIKDAAQLYVLYFCSEELILSNSMRISKSYKSRKASDIVADILLNYLKVDRSKITKFEQTSGVYDYLIPGSRPLEAIQWAVSRSYSTDPKYCYFFYENRDGFCFNSLQSLYKQKPIKKMKYEIKNIDTDPATNRDSIDKFSIINDFDLITSLNTGGIASRALAVDIFHQTYKIYNYSLATAEASKLLLNSHKMFNSLKNQTGKTNFDSYDSHFVTAIEINDTKSEKENSIDKWMMPRALHMSMIHGFRFKGVLPGDILLKAGDIVEFEFPKFVGADEEGKELDEFRTGKYLVTAVNHVFREDVFETIAEFSTDSFADALPGSKDLTQIVKKY